MEKWRVLGKAGLFRLGNYELYGSLLALHINEVVAASIIFGTWIYSKRFHDSYDIVQEKYAANIRIVDIILWW